MPTGPREGETFTVLNGRRYYFVTLHPPKDIPCLYCDGMAKRVAVHGRLGELPRHLFKCLVCSRTFMVEAIRSSAHWPYEIRRAYFRRSLLGRIHREQNNPMYNRIEMPMANTMTAATGGIVTFRGDDNTVNYRDPGYANEFNERMGQTVSVEDVSETQMEQFRRIVREELANRRQEENIRQARRPRIDPELARRLNLPLPADEDRDNEPTENPYPVVDMDPDPRRQNP